MRRIILKTGILLQMLLLVACGSVGTRSQELPVERETVIELVCGAGNPSDCVSQVCQDENKCPLLTALSDPAVFKFVQTYSACEGCNTPQFPVELGIDRCVEYRVSGNSSGWTVTFSVSENCSFRYGSPADSRITVGLGTNANQIRFINPNRGTISDPLYCEEKADCYSLSGSGVPFVGCSNQLYAPLNASGYYAGQECGCAANRCEPQN